MIRCLKIHTNRITSIALTLCLCIVCNTSDMSTFPLYQTNIIFLQSNSCSLWLTLTYEYSLSLCMCFCVSVFRLRYSSVPSCSFSFMDTFKYHFNLSKLYVCVCVSVVVVKCFSGGVISHMGHISTLLSEWFHRGRSENTGKLHHVVWHSVWLWIWLYPTKLQYHLSKRYVDLNVPISRSFWFFSSCCTLPVAYPVSYPVQSSEYILRINQLKDIPERCLWWSDIISGHLWVTDKYLIKQTFHTQLYIKYWELIWGLP